MPPRGRLTPRQDGVVPPDDSTPPVVRRARYADLDPVTAYRIFALREQVFIVEQDCVYADLDGRDVEPGTVHLWIESDDAPVSYLRVLDEGDHARIGRVVTDAVHRGRGLGAVLVRAALGEIGPAAGRRTPRPT